MDHSLVVHDKQKGFLDEHQTRGRGWFSEIGKANLPVGHRFFAVVLDKPKVYAIQEMSSKDFYNWYDVAWFCCLNDVNIEVLDRDLCPDETKTGRRGDIQELR